MPRFQHRSTTRKRSQEATFCFTFAAFRAKMPKVGKYKDLTGQRFGRLVVLHEGERNHRNSIRWLCKCDCGNETQVTTHRLNKGQTQSCGCLNRERYGINNFKHGFYQERLYKVWRGMINRCTIKTNPSYRTYINRGIKVCDRWKEYTNFRDDMSSTYEPGLQIDRIDNDGDYSPENCRWVTHKENQQNKSSTRLIETPDGVMNITQASKFYNIKANTITSRIDDLGWDSIKAVTIAPRKQAPRKKRA